MVEKKEISLKIVFFYSELAQYFVNCAETLAKSFNVEVYIVRWPVNKEAPFQFSFNQVNVYNKSEKTKEEWLEWLEEVAPDIVYSVGWMDKDYNWILKRSKGKCIRVIGMDNQWEGGLKHQLASLTAPFWLRRITDYIWVPGERQKEFGKKLGFKDDEIILGLYCAEVQRFDLMYDRIQPLKRQKRFLYIGRYVEHKGINVLWKAFGKLREKHPDYELWAAGTGELYDKRLQMEGVKHLGFVQPNELEDIVKQTDFFVLPSFFEPWGVVVQEMALLGKPIITTTKVGAADVFVNNSESGFTIPTNDLNALVEAMEKCILLSDEEYEQFSLKSRELSKSITPEMWCKNLLSLQNVRN